MLKKSLYNSTFGDSWNKTKDVSRDPTTCLNLSIFYPDKKINILYRNDSNISVVNRWKVGLNWRQANKLESFFKKPGERQRIQLRQGKAEKDGSERYLYWGDRINSWDRMWRSRGKGQDTHISASGEAEQQTVWVQRAYWKMKDD